MHEPCRNKGVGILGQLLLSLSIADAEVPLQQKYFHVARVETLLLLAPAHGQVGHERDRSYAGGAAEQPRFHPLSHARDVQWLPGQRLRVLDEDIAGTALRFITARLRRRRWRGLLGLEARSTCNEKKKNKEMKTSHHLPSSFSSLGLSQRSK